MPLTAASDLPDHPTLSKPFTSNTLTELTRHAREMVQKEKASLWRIKHLLTRLSGDDTWIPCESLVTDDDISLFFEDRDKARASMLGKIFAKDDADQASTGTLVSDEADQLGLLTAEAHNPELSQSTTPNGAENGSAVINPPKGQKVDKNETISNTDMNNSAESLGNERAMNGVGETAPNASELSAEEGMEMDGAVKPPTQELVDGQEMAIDVASETDVTGILDETGDNPAPRRMRTRAQAQAASDNAASSRTRSATPEFDNDLLVHPYFLAPRTSQADRDVGLPQHEAEETRRLLQLYIQKQEEVCRGAQRIYDGLLRADRYRKLVMKWCKAEAHVGVNRDMSDGEDWYDKEEWGLDEDLKKGQDEEEEDAATTAKKTRSRRQ